MGVPIASKTHFPSMSLIGLVCSKNIAIVYFAGILNNKVTFASTVKILISHRMCGNTCAIASTGIVIMTSMPCRSMIRMKTLLGLWTVTMQVSKPFDHLSFKTESELNALWAVFGTTCSMGLCQRHPKLGQGENIINVVAPQRMETTLQEVVSR